MIEVACQCDEGFGVAHSHTFKMAMWDLDGSEVSLDEWRAHPERHRGACMYGKPDGWVRIWVQWKEVARELSR